MISVKVEGFEEAVKALDVLPDKFQKRALMPIFRKAIRPMLSAARTNLSAYGSSYNPLKKSIGTWNGKSRTSPVIFAGPRVKGKWRDVGYIANWVEYGTSGIKSKNAGTRSWEKTPENEKFAVRVGQVQRGERFRNDEQPRPFMRPAIDATQNTVNNLAIKLMREELNKQIARQIKKLK